MNTSHRKLLLLGYFAGFALVIGFLVLNFTGGKNIKNVTNSLANERIPGLIAVSNLKRDFQAQTIQLYELYATVDEQAYKKDYLATKAAILIDTSQLQSLPEFSNYAADIDKLAQKQDIVEKKFVEIMRQPNIDWDSARAALSEFSQGANKISQDLDSLVTTLSIKTQEQALNSKRLLQQQIYTGLALAGLVLGMLVLIFLGDGLRTKNIKM